LSSSVATTTSGLAGRIGTIEGNYATTGSNIFVGSQVITGSLYITTDLIVQGSSSLQNITASAVSIGTNTVILNTDTPAVRFAGISVQDSGSNAGVTGSIFWDGLCNRWVYSNPSGIGYSGGMLLSGPRTSTLGSEAQLTCNYIAKSGGGDHLYDSCIQEVSGSVTIGGTLCSSGVMCAPSLFTTCFRIDSNGDMYQSTIGATALWGAIGNVTYPTYGFYGNTGIGMYRSAADTLSFAVNGAERFRLLSGGNTYFSCNAFIGSPTDNNKGAKLQITQAASNTNAIDFKNTDVTYGRIGTFANGLYLTQNYYYAGGQNNDCSNFGQVSVVLAAGTTNTSTISFALSDAGTTSPSTRMIMNSSGVACFSNNVCAPNLLISNCATIGTVGFSYPEFRLAVTPIMTVVGAGCTPTSEGIYFKRTSDLCQGGWISGNGGALYIVGQNKHSTAFGNIYFASNNGTTTCDIMVIDGVNQRVGIGTTTPYAKFEVLGGNQCPPSTGTQNYTMALRDPTSMVCGVGGSILFQGYKTGTAAIGNFAYIAGKKENGTAGNESGYISLGNFDSAGNVGERMRISSASCGGVVRIGTCAINWNTNPNAILQVAGAIRFGNPDGDYVPSYGGGISARTLSNFAPGSFAIVVKGLGGSGFLYQIQGFTSGGIRFTDLLFGVNNTFSVIATTGENSPAARAYTITSENLNICIGGSTTYSAIVAHGFGAVER
jgi:hypothetical protein